MPAAYPAGDHPLHASARYKLEEPGWAGGPWPGRKGWSQHDTAYEVGHRRGHHRLYPAVRRPLGNSPRADRARDRDPHRRLPDARPRAAAPPEEHPPAAPDPLAARFPPAGMTASRRELQVSAVPEGRKPRWPSAA